MGTDRGWTIECMGIDRGWTIECMGIDREGYCISVYGNRHSSVERWK